MDGCLAQAGVSFVLPAVSLAFPAVVGGALACGLENSNDAVTR